MAERWPGRCWPSPSGTPGVGAPFPRWSALPGASPCFPGGTIAGFPCPTAEGSTAPVGVDVELVRPHRAGLPAYALSPEELARFDGTWEDFCRLWTLKESWCKREDSPLFPPRDVPVPPPCPHRGYAGEGWRAAVCCSGAPPREILWLNPERLALRPGPDCGKIM